MSFAVEDHGSESIQAVCVHTSVHLIMFVCIEHFVSGDGWGGDWHIIDQHGSPFYQMRKGV